jgi:nitrate reductase alpha subunit
LPVHKEPPKMGGDYPLVMAGGHTRWSIHSIWRDQDHMPRLQRGEPVVYLNAEHARQRGISDHDYVRVWDDVGAFVARARPTGAIRTRQVHIYHAWGPDQLRGGSSDQYISPRPIKITQRVSGYGQLRWGPSYYDPDQNDRDTRVEITKV